MEQSAEHGGVGESDLGGDGGDRLGLGGSASNAGNVETTNSQAIINGSLWGEPLACTAPTPAQFTMPAHGSITLTGTITIDGHTYPFNQTMKY